jgi:hypothetical protein
MRVIFKLCYSNRSQEHGLQDKKSGQVLSGFNKRSLQYLDINFAFLFVT